MTETVCLNMLTADRAWKEDNGKMGMAGIFENIMLQSFPAQILPFSVFIMLGDVKRGEGEIKLVFTQRETQNVISSITAKFNSAEDQETSQLHIPFPGVVIPAPGKYDFELSLNSKQIGRYTISAVQPKVTQ